MRAIIYRPTDCIVSVRAFLALPARTSPREAEEVKRRTNTEQAERSERDGIPLHVRLFDPFFRERFCFDHRPFFGPILRAFSSGSSRGLAGSSEVFKSTRTEGGSERDGERQ